MKKLSIILIFLLNFLISNSYSQQQSSSFNSIGFYIGPGAYSSGSQFYTGVQIGGEYVYNLDNKVGIFGNVSYTTFSVDHANGNVTGDESYNGFDVYAGGRYVFPIANQLYIGGQLGLGFRTVSVSYIEKEPGYLDYKIDNSGSNIILSPGVALTYAINKNFDLGYFFTIIVPINKASYSATINNGAQTVTAKFTPDTFYTIGNQIKLNYNF